MGMYNVVFGSEGFDLASKAQEILGIESFGRTRDCWVENHDGVPIIAVYTRNGGGNREHWDDETEAGQDCRCTGCIQEFYLPSNQYYLRDADDDFDSTYCTSYFSVPDVHQESFLAIAGEVRNKSDEWLSFIDTLKAIPKR